MDAMDGTPGFTETSASQPSNPEITCYIHPQCLPLKMPLPIKENILTFLYKQETTLRFIQLFLLQNKMLLLRVKVIVYAFFIMC